MKRAFIRKTKFGNQFWIENEHGEALINFYFNSRKSAQQWCENNGYQVEGSINNIWLETL
jgi:hypothetical protein